MRDVLEHRPGHARATVVGLTVVAAALLGLVLWRSQALPEGPVAVVWDREACAHCRMHVGEPPFAVQLQTRDGRVLVFDDPGCFFEYVAERHPEVHAVWFRHSREDRWLPGGAVAFADASPTPMGHGLAAVEPGTPGAIAEADARARVLQRRLARRVGP